MKSFVRPLYPSIFVCLLLAACSSTGIIQVNPGVYMISATALGPPAFTGAEEAVRMAYAEAAAYCTEQGRAVDTQSLEKVAEAVGRPGRATLRFRCAEKSR
jgi:hypothetical protein